MPGLQNLFFKLSSSFKFFSMSIWIIYPLSKATGKGGNALRGWLGQVRLTTKVGNLVWCAIWSVDNFSFRDLVW